MTQAAEPGSASIVRNHLDALHASSWLTSYFRRKHQPMAIKVTPERVIKAVHEAGVKCVLMGTHALNTYRDEARATQDVDILVRKHEVRRTIRALRNAYPKLSLQDTPVVARFLDPTTGKGAIDVMKPTQTVYQIVFRHTVAIGETHRIPDLEMALASKFAAMVSPNRSRGKKLIDTGDFVIVVEHNRNILDVEKLKRLAEKVYRGGSAEIASLIEDIDTGRKIRI
jgi:hypothetical protein